MKIPFSATFLIAVASLLASPVAISAAPKAIETPPVAAPAAPAAIAPPVATAPAPIAAPAPNMEPAPATAVAADAQYVPMKPEAGYGQPVSEGMDFQPQITENGRYAKWLNNAILLPLMAAICIFVLGLMLWVVARYRAKANPVPSTTTHNTTIEVIWTAVPILILVAIAVPSIDLLAKQYKPASKDAITIKVKGYQWNWGYEYPDHGVGEYLSKMLDEKAAKARSEPYLLAVDDRMVVPVDTEVKLIITGADVIHSFAMPSLWTKMDAVPGRLNETTFKADRVGVYYGQCSELCGIEHGFMPIAVEVLPKDKFAAWVRFKGGKMPEDTATTPAATSAPAAASGAPATAATPAAATPAKTQ